MSKKYVYLFSEGDASMRELLGEKGAGDYAASLAASLLEVEDLVDYSKKCKETTRGAHSHNWENFNDVKTSVLKELSK